LPEKVNKSDTEYKTIIEITPDNKKLSTFMDAELDEKLRGLKFHVQIYKNIINFFLGNEKNVHHETFNLFTKKFETLSNKMNSVVLSNKDLETIETFIEILSSKNLSPEKYIDIISFLINRSCKTKSLLNEKKIKQKMLDQLLDEMLTKSPEQFINWIT
jgi:signal recognition particle GTPase